jgi:quinoprotein dehydrogenase-associated probable ABC transporter substrate-binding protein
MLKQSNFKLSLMIATLFVISQPVGAAVSADETQSGPKKVAPLRVCADPGNMPMSNDRGEGYSNKIAEIIAKGMGTRPIYFYRPYLNRGLTRQTFSNNECDILMGMTPDDERMLTTKPLFRSTFVLAYKSDKGIDIKSLDDPKLLNDYKVGVFQHSAIRTVLQEHGIKRSNTIVRTIAHNADLKPERQPHMDVQNMLDGKLDIAAIWGPMAGWYKTIKKQPITLVPLNNMTDHTPMEFSLAIGMRKNAKAFKAKIEAILEKEKDKIKQVYLDYGVPLVQCKTCIVSGDIPTHGPYRKVVKHDIEPEQSDVATLPVKIDEALEQGSTLEQELHNATIALDNTRIEYLLQRGAKIDAPNTDGLTPLMLAAQSNDLSVVNGFLAYGANPNAQDHDGWTAAMHAVRTNNPKIFRLMGRHKADFNIVNNDHMTALTLAVFKNKANAAVAMLDHGADPNLKLGDAQYDALMLAVKRGNLQMAQTLLQYKSKPNAKNAGGVTPLMIAAHGDKDMLVSLLLKAGANQKLTNAEGKTAKVLAQESGAEKVLKQLNTHK